jgi:hypothetical protein
MATMKELSRAIAIAPFPVARLVLAHRPAHGGAARASARPLGWPPAIPRRDPAALADVSRTVAVALLVALLALAMLLFVMHTLTRSIPAAMHDMRGYDGSGGCGDRASGVPTRSELDGTPAPLGPAFAC